MTRRGIIRRMKKNKATSPVIKAVLFDLGKVLLHFDFAPAFRSLAKHGKVSPGEICQFFNESGLEVLYDGGKISSLAFYSQVKKGLKLSISFHEFRDIWNNIFTPIGPMVRLVAQLKGKKRLVLISNTNAMHFEYAKKRYAVLQKFDRHILSFKEKIRKPDHKIYKIASKACRARPEEIFYIDDRQDLTDAAKELGFHIHTFKKDHEVLMKTLKEKGVL